AAKIRAVPARRPIAALDFFVAKSIVGNSKPRDYHLSRLLCILGKPRRLTCVIRYVQPADSIQAPLAAQRYENPHRACAGKCEPGQVAFTRSLLFKSSHNQFEVHTT